jgi:simple sugar transport system permease protein
MKSSRIVQSLLKSEISILSVMIIFTFCLMWGLSPTRFLLPGNLQSMAYQLPELGFLSLAMMIVMINGGINLAVVSTANLSGITAAMIMAKLIPLAGGGNIALVVLLAIVAALFLSVIIGIGSGVLVAHVGVSSILATLGMMTFLNGLSILLTKGYVISGFPAGFQFIGNGLVFGVPFPIIIFGLASLILAGVLNLTPFGYELYLVGSNPTATRYSGVSNKSVLMKSYIISSLLCGLSGLVMVSRFNSAKADYGASYLLITVLAAVLGGTSTTGGFGRVAGLVLSLVVLQILSSGLNLLQANAFLTRALWGVILLLVMVINFFRSRAQQDRRD